MQKNILKRIKQLPPRLYIALFCYAVLILVGLFVILPVRSREEQFLLWVFLAVFAILIVKTVVNINMRE